AGILLCALLTGGVLWSNILAYHDVRLAPRPRLAELQHIGNMLAGKGPTLSNEAEGYGATHFLRAGEPVAPSNFGPAVKLLGGESLTSAGFADLDSYPLQTLLSFRSIVTSRSPTQSRPPSAYRLVWQGRWYQLWQRPASPGLLAAVPQAHVPGGDANKLPYCGISSKGTGSRCSIAPASVPTCTDVQRIAKLAAREHDVLVAFQRGEPLVARPVQATSIPPSWHLDEHVGGVIPSGPGTIRFGFNIKIAQHYGVWIGGAFARGVEVAVDGHQLGRVNDPRQTLVTYEPIKALDLAAGGHTVAVSFTSRDLGPNRVEARQQIVLMAVALDPLDSTKSQMLDVAPSDAKKLCGRSLDWIEIAKPRA
ncbi:MAG TPA: hypothetical protein VHZ31_06050, partial [Solirubrobacteraceae bacterium]|nr:hypothetical protein [Solirubrobacteraceae bacterium]